MIEYTTILVKDFSECDPSQKLLLYEKQSKNILLHQSEVYESNLAHAALGRALDVAAMKYVKPKFIAYCKK